MLLKIPSKIETPNALSAMTLALKYLLNCIFLDAQASHDLMIVPD